MSITVTTVTLLASEGIRQKFSYGQQQTVGTGNQHKNRQGQPEDLFHITCHLWQMFHNCTSRAMRRKLVVAREQSVKIEKGRWFRSSQVATSGEVACFGRALEGKLASSMFIVDLEISNFMASPKCRSTATNNAGRTETFLHV